MQYLQNHITGERINMAKKEISQAVIQRLPRYYRYLEDLMDQGI